MSPRITEASIPVAKNTLPILVIIPHGGYRVPDELAGLVAVSNFDLFIQADTCANDLFYFDVSARLDTDISRLFVDLDRPYTALPPKKNGVIKKMTLYGHDVFHEDTFPDEIALANMLRRYYFPFHEAIEKIVDTGGIKLILECHTMMPVGPKISPDPGNPRPLFLLENRIESKECINVTCPDEVVQNLLTYIEKSFSGEGDTVSDRFIHSVSPSRGFIIRNHGKSSIPMIRLSMSRSLFLTDKYFSHEYLRVDEIRINQLRNLLWNSIKKFFEKTFRR